MKSTALRILLWTGGVVAVLSALMILTIPVWVPWFARGSAG
jgi:hypothetical protein